MTAFKFDAQGSSDAKAPSSNLEVRWDWEDDGIWDTGFRTYRQATHQYTTNGIKTIAMEVLNPGGFSARTVRKLLVSDYAIETGSLTDIDGNLYLTVRIGSQWWMAENLKVTRYRDGKTIPKVVEDLKWSSQVTGAWCEHYNSDYEVAVYGRLYNWFSVNNPHILAPAGWHVPSDTEWQQLAEYLGGSRIAGAKMKEDALAVWDFTDSLATNASGFSARPSGYRRAEDGEFEQSVNAWYWSSSRYGDGYAWARRLERFLYGLYRSYNMAQSGFSVRCVKD